MPRLMEVYDVGDKVLLELTVSKVEFDDTGKLKYQLKDERSKRILGWNYRDEDLLPAQPVKKAPVKRTQKKTATKKEDKTK